MHRSGVGRRDHTVSGFVELLNDMRLGNLRHEAKLQIKRLDRRVVYNDGIEPTEMYVMSFYEYELWDLWHA